MQKQAPTLPRLMVMVAFALSCFGLLLFLWLSFGGSTPLKPRGYRFQIRFDEAVTLAKEADVRISGVPVGRVTDLDLDPGTNLTVATLQLRRRYAPVPRDTRAILRQKTLLGETFIELTPGHPRAGMIPEGGELPAGRVAPVVQLDEIFRAFDAKTRRAFQVWMESQAGALRGRGHDLNGLIGTLPPFEEDTTHLLEILDSEHAAVRGVVRDTGAVFSAFADRGDDLRTLITKGNRVFATTAHRGDALRDTFRILPTFQRESRKTFDRVARFSRATVPLVRQLRPAARELSPTLDDLAGLAPDLRALFADLDPLIRVSRRGLPATGRVLDDLRPALREADPLLRNLDPVLSFLSLYRREAATFFANTAAASEYVDQPPNAKRPQHYVRVMGPEHGGTAFGMLAKRAGDERFNPYQLPGIFSRLAEGYPVYDDRFCESSNATSPAPPCRKAAPFDLQGRRGQFPQLRATPPGG